jgi:hypothetical protein
MWKKALTIGGGAALSFMLGAVITYLIMHKRMEDEIEAQVEDVKRVYSAPKPEVETEEVEHEDEDAEEIVDISVAKARAAENVQKKADILSMSSIIKRENYNIFSNPTPAAVEAQFGDDEDDENDEYAKAVTVESPKEGPADRPYIISDTDFIGGHNAHEQVTVNYYNDGILEDALTPGALYDDIDGTIGYDSLNHFGEYEEDVVFVRNERLGIDYEVIRQHRDYAEIPGLDDFE